MNTTDAATFDRFARWSFIAGAVGLALAALGWILRPDAFFHGYLFAFMLWLGVPLGCAAILMVHHLTGGRWGWSIRGILEPALITIPLLALLFIPLLFGLSTLYLWTNENAVAQSHAMQHRSAYLNEPFFFLRAILCFAIWIGGGLLLWRWSRQEEQREVPVGAYRLQALSSVGLILYVLTVTFASIDWVASLSATWFSSIFGMYVLIGQALTALAVAIIVGVLLTARHTTLGAPIPRATLHDLGNLLLMLVVLHAYVAFSQFFIIWNGNLPHEVQWYVPRVDGIWGAMALALILLHFALPFAALLFRQIKRSPAALLGVAVLILVARVIDAAWMVLPATENAGPVLVLLAFAAAVGIGGLWLGLFAWQCARRGLPIPGFIAPQSHTPTPPSPRHPHG